MQYISVYLKCSSSSSTILHPTPPYGPSARGNGHVIHKQLKVAYSVDVSTLVNIELLRTTAKDTKELM